MSTFRFPIPASGGGGAGSDTTAVHVDTANEISSVATKATPVSGDYLLIEDSAAANVKKKITVGSLPSSGADQQLSNLSGTVAIPNGLDILPANDIGINVGSSTKRINIVRAQDIQALGGQVSITSPTGSSSYARIQNAESLPSGVNGCAFSVSPNAVGDAAVVSQNNASGTKNVRVETGNASAGNSGNVYLQTGTATGTRGKVIIKDGSEGTIGHVLTSVDTSGTAVWAAPAAGGANVTLSNLTNTIAIPNGVDLQPLNANQASLGSFSKYFNSVYSRAINLTFGSNIGQLGGFGLGMPSGATANVSIASLATYNIGILTASQSSASTHSKEIRFETGNATGATSNSGDFIFQSGTATGTRGKVKLSVLMVTLPVGTSDPTGVDNGDAYYNTSSNELRVYNGGTWRGTTLA